MRGELDRGVIVCCEEVMVGEKVVEMYMCKRKEKAQNLNLRCEKNLTASPYILTYADSTPQTNFLFWHFRNVS